MKTSSGILFFRRTRGLELLLVRPAGFKAPWSIPKGRMEEGETPLHAALREADEEAGMAVGPGDLLYLGEIVYPSKKKRMHCYAYESCMEPTIKMPQEIDMAAWFAIDEASSLVHQPQRTFLSQLCSRIGPCGPQVMI